MTEIIKSNERQTPLEVREENLIKAGVTRKKVYEALEKGILAKKTVVEYDADGNGKTVEVSDLVVAHKYVETALKVFGDLVDVKTEVNVDASRKELNITTEEREELKRIREMIHGGKKAQEG